MVIYTYDLQVPQGRGLSVHSNRIVNNVGVWYALLEQNRTLAAKQRYRYIDRAVKKTHIAIKIPSEPGFFKTFFSKPHFLCFLCCQLTFSFSMIRTVEEKQASRRFISTMQGCIVHLGHWAMARPIIEGISRVRARELVMSRISRVQLWPTVVNSHVRTCAHTTIDHVAILHARNFG